MLKGLFFSLPSVSVSKTLTPVIDRLPKDKFTIICYNTAAFQSKVRHELQFRAYPDYEKGYNTDKIDGGTSYFQFAEILTDTTISLLDFLCEEVEREKPDFILHSHLASWGKWIARRYTLPAVGLFTTFIMDEKIMLPWFRKVKAEMGSQVRHIDDVFGLFKKLHNIHKKLGLEGSPDIWDVYVNREELNLSFILPGFQPERGMLNERYKFLGFPLELANGSPEKELIYVSMGTVMNKDLSIYILIIEVLKKLGIESVIAIGRNVEALPFGSLPSFIRVVDFADQVALLGKATIFITRGGMASIQESMYTLTPVIVIPEIPEQQITAATAEELGVGIHVPVKDISVQTLLNSILRIRDNYQEYYGRLKALSETIPDNAPHVLASIYIEKYLRNCLAPEKI